MLSSILYACVLAAALGFAFAKGCRTERAAASILLLGNASTLTVLAFSRSPDFTYVSAAYLLIDVAGAAALCAMAILRPSWLAVLLATFQINGTLGHVVKLVAPETVDISYAILLRIWGWPMALTMLVARWNPYLRRILRQSDLHRLPSMARPRSLTSSMIRPGLEIRRNSPSSGEQLS